MKELGRERKERVRKSRARDGREGQGEREAKKRTSQFMVLSA